MKEDKTIISTLLKREMSPLYVLLREASIHYKTRIKPIVICRCQHCYTYEPVTQPHTVLTFNTVEDRILAGILLEQYNSTFKTLSYPEEVNEKDSVDNSEIK